MRKQRIVHTALAAAAALFAAAGIALLATGQASALGGSHYDLITVNNDFFCPSSTTLNGGHYPNPCLGKTFEFYDKGARRGQTISFNGPWKIRCSNTGTEHVLGGGSASFPIQADLIRQDIGTFNNPCRSGATLTLRIQRSSTAYGEGLNFAFMFYIPG